MYAVVGPVYVRHRPANMGKASTCHTIYERNLGNRSHGRWGWTQSTYIPRVPQCLTPRRNWELPPPPPLLQASAFPWNQKGETHSPGGSGGGPIRTTGEKAWPSVYSVGVE